MYTEITINNAVVRVFIKLLQDSVGHPMSRRSEPQLYLRSGSNSPTGDDGKVAPCMTALHAHVQISNILC